LLAENNVVPKGTTSAESVLNVARKRRAMARMRADFHFLRNMFVGGKFTTAASVVSL
jgi:hypothetical protein